MLIEAALGTVMVGEDQAFRGDEGGGAVREPDERSAGAVEPGMIDVRAVLALDQIARKVIEGPHPGIGVRGGSQDEHEERCEEASQEASQEGAAHGSPFLFRCAKGLHYP